MSTVRYGTRPPRPACCVCGASPTTDTRFGPRCIAHVPAETTEQDRRCPSCQTWLDRYGNCPQCREPDEWDEGNALPEEGR